MISFVIWRLFCFWWPNYFWQPFCFPKCSIFRRSIWTTMQNPEPLAWKMSDLLSVLWFGGHFVFCNLLGLSIWNSMHNLYSVAQEVNEICPILKFGGHFCFVADILFCNFFQNFFGLCSSKNECVILNLVFCPPFPSLWPSYIYSCVFRHN